MDEGIETANEAVQSMTLVRNASSRAGYIQRCKVLFAGHESTVEATGIQQAMGTSSQVSDDWTRPRSTPKAA